MSKLECSSYLDKALTDPARVVAHARDRLRGVKFDVIVVSGTSGLLIGPLMARAMRKRLAVVRKNVGKDSEHATHIVEGYLGGRFLFVDDLISSGKTRDYVMRQYRAACAQHDMPTEFAGSYLYNDTAFWRDEE
jgi:adenine/guanine phosphoribosyltransferase-like PRPP-binding protein